MDSNSIGEYIKATKDIVPNTYKTIDNILADRIEEKLNSKSKIDDMKDKISVVGESLKGVREVIPEASKAVDETTTVIIETVGKELVRRIEEKLQKKHGSKVKVGKFCGCPIVYAGTKSCIVVDRMNHNKLVYLIPENVKSCCYVEKKFKLHKMENDYYYAITFVDGSESYIRVSQKHQNNLDSLVGKANYLEKND